MKWDINLQNIQDEYTMLTTIFIFIIAKLYIDMKIMSNTGSKSSS